MGIAPRPSGFATTKDGKKKILERTKALLDTSSMVITIPFKGVTKEDTDLLKKALPETVTASIVKNTLMKLSCEGTPFEPISDVLQEQNLFFFVPEGDAKAGFNAFKKWQKEVKRTEPEFSAKCLTMDGQNYIGSQLDYVTSLPTKEELITKIAIGIKSPSLKLARSIKAVPNKVGRAFGAYKTKLEEEGA